MFESSVERMEDLKKGLLLMLPSIYYGQAFYLKRGEIWRYSPGAVDSIEDSGEILDYLADPEEHVESFTIGNFDSVSYNAWLEHFYDDEGCYYEGPLETRFECNKCGSDVHIEAKDEIDYPYYCPECDENKYGFEVTTNSRLIEENENAESPAE